MLGKRALFSVRAMSLLIAILVTEKEIVAENDIKNAIIYTPRECRVAAVATHKLMQRRHTLASAPRSILSFVYFHLRSLSVSGARGGGQRLLQIDLDD